MHILLLILWIVIWIVVILFSITIHELGHFIALKSMKVFVHEFSIGFGPKIFSWGKGETKYYLRWIPLGGYVIGASKLSREVFPDANVPENRLIDALPYYKKMFFVLAGITINVLFALIMSLFYFAFHFTNPELSTYAGFLKMGVGQFFLSMESLFTGNSTSISSNIEVASNFASFEQAMAFIVFLLVFINFNLAILNVVPFPPLDGWKGAEFTYESITKKEIKEKTRIIVTFIGIACLLVLTIFSFIAPYI